jgi:predicted O-methyltransferase YrrM
MIGTEKEKVTNMVIGWCHEHLGTDSDQKRFFEIGLDQRAFLEQLYSQTLEYQKLNRRGAFPFEYFEALIIISASIQKEKKATTMLELGSALGLSAISLAIANPEAKVISVDKNEKALELAKANAKQAGAEKQIEFVNARFEEFLSQQTSQFDLIFFDGFAPEYKLFLQMESVLKPRGILVSANMDLFIKDKQGFATTDTQNCHDRLCNPDFYKGYLLFDDTVLAVKL